MGCHGVFAGIPALGERLRQHRYESHRGSGAGGQAALLPASQQPSPGAAPVSPAPRHGDPATPSPLQLRRPAHPHLLPVPAPRAGQAGRRRRSRGRRGALRPLRRSGRGIRTRRRRLGGAGRGRAGDGAVRGGGAAPPPPPPLFFFLPQPPLPVEAALPGSPGALGMRRIRANAIAILTVAWILGTFYYLWQDNKPRSAAAGRSAGGGSGGARSGQRAAGRLELRREERTIPLIVSERRLAASRPAAAGRMLGEGGREGAAAAGAECAGGGLRFAFGLLSVYFSIRACHHGSRYNRGAGWALSGEQSNAVGKVFASFLRRSQPRLCSSG